MAEKVEELLLKALAVSIDQRVNGGIWGKTDVTQFSIGKSVAVIDKYDGPSELN